MDTTPLQKFVDDNHDSNPTLILKIPNNPDTVFVPTPVVVTPSIDALLIHEITSGRLTPLTSTIDLNLYSPFNIQANCTNAQSVGFLYDAVALPVENIAPFCTNGDDKPLDVQPGNHTLGVMAFSEKGATGIVAKQTVTFVATKIVSPAINRIVQSDSVYAFDIQHGDKTISDTCVTQGGLIRFKSPNGTLKLYRVYSEGACGALGIYFVLVATNSVKEVLWDNTGLADRWICSGPDSGGRFMGLMPGVQKLTIINVDFVTRLHEIGDDQGAKLAPIPQLHPLKQPDVPHGWKGLTQWKQNPQVRCADLVAMIGTLPNKELPNGQGRVVGLLDIGQQATPETKQYVRDMTIMNYGFENLPHFTKSYGTVRMSGCFRIDENGIALKDSSGKLQMWPDKVFHGS